MMHIRRPSALVLLAVMVGDLLAPTMVLALTSGPSQPEVQGFSPIGNTDMVDLFSGDFSYNIPLLDVEGYPINLSYRAGIGMDQEASWVGLGWSLNPGVVERNLRGLPDDFNGDQVVRHISMRPNVTVGAEVGLGAEIFGADVLHNTLVLSANPSYNNYDGIRFSTGANMGLRSCEQGKSGFTANLGLSSGSHDGFSMQPSVGVEKVWNTTDKKQLTGGLNFGLSMSSRQGMSNLSFGTTLRLSDLKQVTTQSTAADGTVTTKTKTVPKTRLRYPSVGTSFGLGQPTYSPQVPIPMQNTSFSLRASLGSSVGPLHPGTFVSGSYSQQKVRSNTISRSAFGYLHLGNGQGNRQGILDMNRDKDGPYRASDRSLPVAMLTNDIFSVSGQNMGGSYRAYRDEVGHVFDSRTSSGGVGGSAGIELGFGGVSGHVGVDITMNQVTTTSGDWQAMNTAGDRLLYKTAMANPLDEHVYFRESSEPVVERDASLYDTFGGDQALRFSMRKVGAYDVRLGEKLEDDGGAIPLPSTNEKRARDPRGQIFTYLSHREAAAGLGLEPLVARDDPDFFTGIGHHMSEVTITGTDGNRNVYGIPAYNLVQHDVTFAIGGDAPLSEDVVLVGYGDEDNSTSNTKGKDHFFSRSTTPRYAYAFLLTAALSSDYSDVDEVSGPSPDDLGSYTKFSYDLADPDFPWRTPAGEYQARLDRGLGAIGSDDKASYVFGRKEIWYLNAVESRNMIAVFRRGTRDDGKGIAETGAITTNAQERLLRIDLYERKAYHAYLHNGGTEPTPIKSVHFVYDEAYPLCPGTPNSIASSQGKLTLKSLYFTYGTSHRGITSPYVFHYDNGGASPAYDMAAMDRWGNYKPENASGLPNHSYPYVEQDPATANAYASAWALTKIQLPSGGTIETEYESDDYAFVQNSRAHRMFRVVHISPYWGDMGTPPAHPTELPPGPVAGIDYAGAAHKRRFYFELPSGFEPSAPSDPAIHEFFKDMGGVLYYRFKTRIELNGADGYDYVSGYASIGAPDPGVTAGFVDIDGVWYGWFTVASEHIDEVCVGACSEVMPMYRSALEMARREYAKELYQPDGMDENGAVIQLVLAAAASIAGWFTALEEMLEGPNKYANGIVEWGFGDVVLGEGWVRFSEPTGHKLGGGHRVRQITITDAWESMVTPSLPGRSYGQEYTYLLGNGMSSGVAAWEPSMGADENVWRRPYFGTVKVPPNKSERFYQEEPFGECHFPAPTVGYSRVVVRDIYPDGVVADQQGTGHVEHEFYTARDFPVITSSTRPDMVPGKSNFSVLSLLKVKVTDNVHTSQGFVIETNDMHGKPRRTAVYPQALDGGGTEAISSVEYFYSDEPYGSSARLNNRITTIAPDGSTNYTTIGRHYEFLADMREYSSRAFSGGLGANTDIVPFAFFLSILANSSVENTAYRSGVFVKKIHRFGLLRRVVRMEYGSKVTTWNHAYDAETGAVLLTSTDNEFSNPVFSMRFPAYWYYDGMGPAYRNIRASLVKTLSNSGFLIPNAAEVFALGDELALWPEGGGTASKAWVSEVGPGHVKLVDRHGTPLANGVHYMTVLRSGRRNMQITDMATLSLMTWPLVDPSGEDPIGQGLNGSIYQKILSAQAMEFSGTWRSECDCLDSMVPLNCFVANRCGVWRLNKEHAWLTDRTRTTFDKNTDIRRDGIYASFDPFYKAINGRWELDRSGWTSVREVTEYSPRGMELENRDALGLYSSATFAHGGSVPNSVARNARYTKAAFESFEEGEEPNCMDRRLEFVDGLSGRLQYGMAHSGRYSVRVTDSESLEMVVPLAPDCPTEECALELELTEDGETWYWAAVNGSPPFVFETEVISGEPLVFFHGSDGLVVGGAGEIQVVVTDSKGCSAEITTNVYAP